MAQRLAPESRIVYVDNDPLVLAHARACSPARPRASRTTSTPTCTTPSAILAEAAKTLDLTQPVALLLIGVLGHVADYDEARSIVRRLLAGAAVGQLPGE